MSQRTFSCLTEKHLSVIAKASHVQEKAIRAENAAIVKGPSQVVFHIPGVSTPGGYIRQI